MPVIPENISDLYFNEKDLYLDVRLTTISSESIVVTDPDTGLVSQVEDFTGFPTFKTGFFREQVGFGITNIKVETNTSLQPIVEIEFKDLFGKTVFGELSDVDTDGVNYSSLFQWPPPKFVFTFKGYLGSPVTWLLNMKTTSTQYNSDDGSYTLKATFIPNQWGMFADIPFLYLYAAKKLRADALPPDLGKDTEEYIEKTESIVDLMYIGKSIEVETKSLTKEYDEIVTQLELMKRDPIQGIISGTLSFLAEGESNLITSKVPGRGEIPDFQVIKVTRPSGDMTYREEEEVLIPALKNLSVSLRNFENYKVKIASIPGVVNTFLESTVSLLNVFVSDTSTFGQIPDNDELEKLKQESKALNVIIDKNLEIINNTVKANLYKENATELRKLTISEVFSRIARDTAYIMGYIIDAGEQGYFNNSEERNKAEESTTIGRYYPMIFEEPKEGTKDLGNQVPAKGMGTEDFEKKFVTDFITAISFGIAENRALQKEADEGSDKTIKHTINNLELGQDNPYLGKSNWADIASIMIKRTAIVSFLTQSYNPALPGNLEPEGITPLFTNWKKNDDYDKIRALASADLANITDVVLAQLDTENLQKLKEFCLVIRAWLKNPDGYVADYFDDDVNLPWKWGTYGIMQCVIVTNPGLRALAKTPEAKNIIEKVREEWADGKRLFNFEEVTDVFKAVYDAKSNSINTNSSIGSDLKNAGMVCYTFEEFMQNLIGSDKAFFGSSSQTRVSGRSIQKQIEDIGTAAVDDKKNYVVNYSKVDEDKLKLVSDTYDVSVEDLKKTVLENKINEKNSTDENVNVFKRATAKLKTIIPQPVGYVPTTWGNGLDFETSMGTWVGMGKIVYAHTCQRLSNEAKPGTYAAGPGTKHGGNMIEYAVWSDSSDVSVVSGAQETGALQSGNQAPNEDEEEAEGTAQVFNEVAKVVLLDSPLSPYDADEPDGENKINEYMQFYNARLSGQYQEEALGGFGGRGVGTSEAAWTFYDFKKASKNDMRVTVPELYNPEIFNWNKKFGPTDKGDNPLGVYNLGAWDSESRNRTLESPIDVRLNPVAIAPYAQYPEISWGQFLFVPLAGALSVRYSRPPLGCGTEEMRNSYEEIEMAEMALTFLRKYVLVLLPKIQKIQDEVDKVFGQILGKAGEHEDLIYKQMHTLFHQWQILGSRSDGSRINQPEDPKVLTPNVAEVLQGVYGKIENDDLSGGPRERNDGSVLGGGFRYDYPLQAIGASDVRVSESLINLGPLYSAKANTTTLNIFQQLCSKNNFMFFPICGNARYNKVSDIFAPQEMMGPKIGNFFQVMFQPTPESRTLVGNDTEKKQSLVKDLRQFEVEAFPVAFGDPTNKIIKNVTVSTDENKVTAESIVNLQAIVDNENKNRTVTTDCSLLSVFEGRSYKAGVETIGNAQVSPMQFFFLENHTIFTGLYQIIKVSHKITPNDMTTDLTGIKMRYGGNSYGGVLPITLQDFEEAAGFVKEAPFEGRKELTAEEQAILDSTSNFPVGSPTSGGEYAVTGTDKGAKTVAGYLSNKDKKRRIDKIILKCVEEGITSNLAIASLLSISSKESSFDLKAEGFYYSAERLPQVWSYFKKNDPVANGFVNPKTKKADEDKYQEKIANIVYTQKPIGVRSDGYGNTKQGDGWKYRGRGYNQITFKSGYEKASKTSGVDLVRSPEKLLDEDVATAALVGFFNGRRKTKKFGNSTGGYTSREEGYGCTDDGVTFPDLKNAVFFYYHCNTGPGKTVADVKHKLNPEDPLGGMRKAQSRAPSFLEYINNNFAEKGVKILPANVQNSSNNEDSSSAASAAASEVSNSVYSGRKTWDPKSDERILIAHPKIRAKIIEFVIRAEKEIGTRIRITSTLRTFPEQQKLYDQGRGDDPGKVVTNAKPGSSAHNYGLAIDILDCGKSGKEGLWNSPNEAQIVSLAKSIGFSWGGDWTSFTDKPHFDILFGRKISELKKLYENGERDGEYVNI
jgi:predicted chitinase